MTMVLWWYCANMTNSTVYFRKISSSGTGNSPWCWKFSTIHRHYARTLEDAFDWKTLVSDGIIDQQEHDFDTALSFDTSCTPACRYLLTRLFEQLPQACSTLKTFITRNDRLNLPIWGIHNLKGTMEQFSLKTGVSKRNVIALLCNKRVDWNDWTAV